MKIDLQAVSKKYDPAGFFKAVLQAILRYHPRKRHHVI